MSNALFFLHKVIVSRRKSQSNYYDTSRTHYDFSIDYDVITDVDHGPSVRAVVSITLLNISTIG